LLDIGAHTLRTWGEEQMLRYLDDLEAACRGLAGPSELGRACDQIRPGLRRIERGEHVVFYRQERGGVFICRILHKRMLPLKHAIDDEDE
jgi:toxin ParE1/3/4